MTGTLTRPRTALVALAVLAACGPDLVERAELDEVCGQPAPFRLLELDPDESIASMQQTLLGQWRIFSVGYWDQDVSESAFGVPLSNRAELWSVGRCGESPRLLASDPAVRVMTLPDVWPDVLFGCNHETGEVFTLDPEGVRPSNVVLELPECDGTPTPHGMLTVEAHDDDDLGALVLQSWPDDPWTERATARVLLEPIRISSTPGFTWPSFREVTALTADEALVITEADELVSLSLPEGEPVVEASGVRRFELSPGPEQHLIAWQDLEVTNDDEDSPQGAVYVRDRETGTTTYLADGKLGPLRGGTLELAESGLLRMLVGEQYQERLWSWPSLSSVDLPPGTWSVDRIPDGRVLISDWLFYDGPLELFDPTTGSIQPLFDEGGYPRILEDGVEVTTPACCLNRELRSPTSLWFVTWDGQRERLAHRVTFGHDFLPDDRVLTTVDVGEDWLGSLIVVQPETLDELLLDDHVVLLGRAGDDQGEVVYAVEDGDRTGVWITKPAESPTLRSATAPHRRGATSP